MTAAEIPMPPNPQPESNALRHQLKLTVGSFLQASLNFTCPKTLKSPETELLILFTKSVQFTLQLYAPTAKLFMVKFWTTFLVIEAFV